VHRLDIIPSRETLRVRITSFPALFWANPRRGLTIVAIFPFAPVMSPGGTTAWPLRATTYR
jgi:hypothetical protein